MEKIVFETPEQIKEYYVGLIKSGKKIKDEEIFKACHAICMSEDEIADLIDEILSISEDDADLDFDASQANDLEVEMLLEDEVFATTSDTDLLTSSTCVALNKNDKEGK